LPRFTWICALALASSAMPGGLPARALPDAMPDGSDRFPFVVAIKAQGQLICSGTLLYPRIVVTAAHCLQQAIAWRGMRIYVDDYLSSELLSVGVVQDGKMRSYGVTETAVSPGWLAAESGQPSARLPYDIALLVIDEPIDVGVPLGDLIGTSLLTPSSPVGAGRHHGVLVAFGGAHCVAGGCPDAGVRRYLPVVMKDGGTCFKSRRDREAGLRFSVWCMDSVVLPGDSGGALLVEAPDGVLHYAGVISARSGLPPALASLGTWRQSAAASLEPNLDFIEAKARTLGYAPVTSGP
jgi:trypsin